MKLRHLFLALTGAALAAGQPVFAGCELTKLTTLEAHWDHGRIFTPGKLDGKPVQFMVATGSPTFILPGAAHDMEFFPLLGARFQTVVYEEELERGPTMIHKLNLAGVDFKEVILHVLGRQQNFGANDAVAVLGRDFLRNFDVEFNMAANQITLFRSKGCEATNLAYWTTNYNVLDLNQAKVGLGVTAIVNGRSLSVALDSGLPYTVLKETTAHDLAIDGASASLVEPSHDMLTNHPFETWIGKADSVTLDQETVKPAYIRFRNFPLPPPQTGSLIGGPAYKADIDSETGMLQAENPAMSLPGRVASGSAEMILGADFLRAHRVLVATSQARLYFSYEPGNPFLNKPH